LIYEINRTFGFNYLVTQKTTFMKKKFWLTKLPAALLVGALVVTAAAWQTQPGKYRSTLADTVPERSKKVRDIDDAIKKLDESKVELDRTLQNREWEKEIQESLKNVHIDAEKMKTEIAEAMKSLEAIDLQKMQVELQKELASVDAEKIKTQVAEAMKQVDLEKIQKNLDASLSKIDMNKIKEEMDRVKEIDFKQLEENIKKIQPEIEKSMKGARESIEKAKKELTEYKGFIDELDKDQLINKKEPYTIEYRKGELSINGKKQPAETVKKYSSFLKDRKDFTIKKEADGFNINND
jgi:hypothetical protein